MKLIKFSCACAAIALSSSAFSQGDEIIVIAKTDSTGVYREQSTPANPTAAEGNARNKAAAEIAAKTKEAADKAREKSRADCLVKGEFDIQTDQKLCERGYQIIHSAAIRGCAGPNEGLCKEAAASDLKAGNLDCEADALTKRGELPEISKCKR